MNFQFLKLSTNHASEHGSACRGGLGLKTGPGNFRQPLYWPNLTCTLPAQPWPNPNNRLFYTQKSPFLPLQPCQPTGHCPNASMASPPLSACHISFTRTLYSQFFYSDLSPSKKLVQ